MGSRPDVKGLPDHKKTKDQLIAEVNDLREQLAQQKSNGHDDINALKWFEAIFENTPMVAIQGFTRDGTITHWNRASKHQYGYSSREAIGKRIQDLLLRGEEVSVFEKTLGEIWSSGLPSERREWVLMTSDGEKRHVISTMFPIFDRGSIVEAFCMDVDITDRLKAEGELSKVHEDLEMRVQQRTIELKKINESLRNEILERNRAEEALRDSEANLAKAQCIAHLGNWEIQLPTNGIKWSREVYNIFGLNPDEHTLSWTSAMSLMYPGDEWILAKFYSSIMNDGEISNVDFRIMRPDGSVRYVRAEADKILKDENGSPIKLFGIIQDITERKQAEKALEEAKLQAELYVDLMGHDINNMNQVGMGFLELTLDTLSPDDAGRSYISKAFSAFENSSRLVDNVKKLQKIRSGELEKKEMDVGRVLTDITDHYSRLHRNTATINYVPVSGCIVMADDLLLDLFSNLVGNAMKHSTEKPIVDISIGCATENGRGHYRITVEDNGHGIRDDFKVIIFNRHLRSSVKSKGSGVGLYLVKALVENYKGRVWVEDRVPGDMSKGSRFVVMLPASKK